MKPRTVKKGFLGVMGLFLLSALTPALIPFAVDKNGDLTQIGYAADAVMIVSIAATIYCALHIEVNDFLAITALVFALAGVYAHFLFNGNVYFYIWNSRNRQRKRQTKERQNKEEQEGMKA